MLKGLCPPITHSSLLRQIWDGYGVAMIRFEPANGATVHFHIHWSTCEILDWQAFPSRASAEQCAHDLVQPDETFTIETRDETCPRCRNIKNKTAFAS